MSCKLRINNKLGFTIQPSRRPLPCLLKSCSSRSGLARVTVSSPVSYTICNRRHGWSRFTARGNIASSSIPLNGSNSRSLYGVTGENATKAGPLQIYPRNGSLWQGGTKRSKHPCGFQPISLTAEQFQIGESRSREKAARDYALPSDFYLHQPFLGLDVSRNILDGTKTQLKANRIPQHHMSLSTSVPGSPEPQGYDLE